MQQRVSRWGLWPVGRYPIYTRYGSWHREVPTKRAELTWVAAASGKRGHTPRTTTMGYGTDPTFNLGGHLSFSSMCQSLEGGLGGRGKNRAQSWMESIGKKQRRASLPAPLTSVVA